MSSKQQAPAAPADTRKLLTLLRAAKAQQDLTAQPARGRGLWLNSQTWQAVVKQLELQVAEVEELQRELHKRDQEAADFRHAADSERQAQQRVIAELQSQIPELMGQVAALGAQMAAKQEAWEQHKRDLEAQADHLLGLLHDRQGLLSDNDGLRQHLAGAQAAAATAERRAAAASARATELQRMHEYMMGKGEAGLTERDAQALRIRDLTTSLAEARHQADTYRLQLQQRTAPAEELTRDLKRLRADNRRLVSLLAGVPEYRVLAAEVAAEHGVSYVPLEECLMARGLVEDLHPQMLDRPVDEVAGGVAGPGRRRDPDGPDPSLTVVLDEQYHWVPRAALATGAALMRRMLPALPMSQLMALVAELNKVWRDRERARLSEVAAAHREELRRLQDTFHQRAPYEAVVAGQKLNDLKRRMRAQAAQAAAAAAAAKDDQRRGEDDSKAMLHAGLSTITDLSKQVAKLVTRNKRVAGKAARQRALAETRGQPVCSTCLDRLLLPASNEAGHYLGRALGVESQRPPPPAPASAPATTLTGASHRPSQHQHQHHYQTGSDSPYHEPQLWTGPDPTATAAAGSRGAASMTHGSAAALPPTDAHGSTLRVNLVQPSGSPPPPLSSMSVWRQREAAAAAAAATGSPTRHAVPVMAAATTTGLSDLQWTGGSGATTAASAPTTLQLESTMEGVTITAIPPGPASSYAWNGSGGGGGGGGLELSAASLSDWRVGGGGGGGVSWGAAAAAGPEPVTVQLQMGPGASPNRTVLLTAPGAGAGSVSGGGSLGGGGGGGTAATQVQQRGTPMRVSVRFPRQDMPGSWPRGMA